MDQRRCAHRTTKVLGCQGTCGNQQGWPAQPHNGTILTPTNAVLMAWLCEQQPYCVASRLCSEVEPTLYWPKPSKFSKQKQTTRFRCAVNVYVRVWCRKLSYFPARAAVDGNPMLVIQQLPNGKFGFLSKQRAAPPRYTSETMTLTSRARRKSATTR